MIPAPQLARHNQYLFGEILGISGGEIADLLEKKIFYETDEEE